MMRETPGFCGQKAIASPNSSAGFEANILEKGALGWFVHQLAGRKQAGLLTRIGLVSPEILDSQHSTRDGLRTLIEELQNSHPGC
jgi:hypothetical protein